VKPLYNEPASAEEDTEIMFDDVTLKIIDVGDKRINRLNDRFVRYLLAGERSKLFLTAGCTT
jgi:hypothetical protein